jgi:hypothetical protein
MRGDTQRLIGEDWLLFSWRFLTPVLYFFSHAVSQMAVLQMWPLITFYNDTQFEVDVAFFDIPK